MKRTIISSKILLATICVLAMSAAATAAEISFPPITAKPGDAVALPVILDHVDNLAGVKLVMTYDPDLLTFSKAEKTRYTSSMMHIVNDKKPGTLIAVMAAARGVKGDDFPILTLEFQVNAAIDAPSETAIAIREAQLMSDDLKDIPYTVNTPPLKILGKISAEAPEKQTKKTDDPEKSEKGEGGSACGHE